MGFMTREYGEPGDPYTGPRANSNDAGGDGGDGGNGFATDAGDLRMDAEAGLIEDFSQMPGLKFEKWDPAYPHEQYDQFMKVRLRRIGAGLDMSYYAIANDLTEVNFSSIRAGLLEDREHFKALQTWWIYHFEAPIFLKWLQISLASGAIKDPISGNALPFSKLAKFSKHKFRPRRWPWVDPMKDAQANVLAVDNRLKSRGDVIEETSQSTFEEVVGELAQEQKFAESQGVELPPVAGFVPEKPEPDGDENKEGGEGKPKPTKKKA